MNLLRTKLFFGHRNFTEIIKSTCRYFYENLEEEIIRYKVS